MLPPIPLSLVPVTAQQDIPKPRPEMVPVTPIQASAQESLLTPDRRHPQESFELIYEELQHHKQHQEHHAESKSEEEAVEEYLEVEEPELEEQRQGLWIDTQA